MRGLLSEKVSIVHVAGSENPADAPSRLVERPASRCPSVTIGSLIQKRFVRLTAEKSSKKIAKADAKAEDMVRRFTALEPGGELAEVVSSASYDVQQAVWYVQLMKHLLMCWRSAGRARVPFPTPTFETENLKLFCRSAQRIDPDSPVEESTRFDFNGEAITTYSIPKSAAATVSLIARSAHRASLHRGISHTCSLVGTQQFPFKVQGFKSAVSNCIRNCFRCAVKNQLAPVIGSLGHTFPREINLPTFSRIACDVLFIDNKRVLSAMCIDTGFLALLLIDSTRIVDCVSGLKRLMNRFGVRIKYIRADRAFKSTRLVDSLPGVEVSLTAPDTPYTNPVERLHAEARCIIRSEKFIRRCIVDGSDLQVQDALDQIASVVNSRPLGRFCEGDREGIITPATLAFGSSMKSNELIELRSYFYQRIFSTFRRAFAPSRPGLRLLVGQRALYFSDFTSKSQPRFELCRIVDIRPPYYSIRLIGTDCSEKEKIVGRGSLAPLHLPFLPPDPSMNVTRVGARICIVYNFDGIDEEFTGLVVRDEAGEIEVQWDDPRWTRNELIDWGACRVL